MYYVLNSIGANTAFIGGGGISRNAGPISPAPRPDRGFGFGDEWGASIGGSGSPMIHSQFSEQG